MSPSQQRSSEQRLAEVLTRFDIVLPADQVALVDHYCHLLWDWNERINLTRHTDLRTFVCRDVVDTLQLSALIGSGEEILDVGSGGGVPGVLLAVVRPDLRVSVCETVAKKIKVLKDIVGKLDLAVPVYHERAEGVLEDFRFDTLTVRAVGPLRKLVTWFSPHWASIGRLLLIKGPKWIDERGEARHYGLMQDLQLRRLASYQNPDTQVESCILELRHASHCSTGQLPPNCV